ncbi:MAG: selenocysteine-specific translation elongation factor [candidate division NC10 bacterium]|nr:selenocysteine-specific translation elongation factor [candidate division NC10 bacterium]
MKHVIVGTAGHIDHGKTALVKALTGIDTDRLKEEKERGISIELGFAFLRLERGITLGIVDVPGHERFVKTMLAGVGGIDLVILVIAADEGVMPQTREHLHICELLGVPRGLVALTKKDLVDPEWLDLVQEEIRTFLTGTFLDEAPILPVSSLTGDGLHELRDALAGHAAKIQSRRGDGIVRLPIDRVFTIRGFGTIVTGTLWTGSLAIGDEVTILPKDLPSRVRRLQVHNESVERASAGQRTAVNLPGLETDQIERGDLLCLPGTLRVSTSLEATLALLPDAPRPLHNRARVRFHLGTVEILARTILLDREKLNPGEETYAHLRLERPTAAMPHDRYVLRSYSPATTIGGGVILDPSPSLKRRRRPEVVAHLKILERGSSRDRLLQILKSNTSPLSPSSLQSLAGLDPEALQGELRALLTAGKIVQLPGRDGEAYLHREIYEDLCGTILSLLRQFHAQNPLREGISKEELRSRLARGVAPALFDRLLNDLTVAKEVAQDRDRVRLTAHRPQLSAAEAALTERLETLYRTSGLQPPTVDAAFKEAGADRRAAQAVFFRLVEQGTLTKITGDLYVHHDAYEQAKARLLEHLAQHSSISVPTFKDLLGVTRKHAIPYLEHFDQIKLTRRAGDDRVLYGR